MGGSSVEPENASRKYYQRVYARGEVNQWVGSTSPRTIEAPQQSARIKRKNGLPHVHQMAILRFYRIII